jgi:hypothetical protein
MDIIMRKFGVDFLSEIFFGKSKKGFLSLLVEEMRGRMNGDGLICNVDMKIFHTLTRYHRVRPSRQHCRVCDIVWPPSVPSIHCYLSH